MKTGYQTKAGKHPVFIKRFKGKFRADVWWKDQSRRRREPLRDLAGQILSTGTAKKLQKKLAKFPELEKI